LCADRAFRALLLLGLLARLAALPLPGTGDLSLFRQWGRTAVLHGTTRAYQGAPEAEGRQKRLNYPPGALYLFAASAAAYARFDPHLGDSRAFTALIKVPTLVADALVAGLLWWALGRRPGGARPGRFAVLAWWLNPAVMLNGAVLGYLDPLLALAILGALAAAAGGRAGLAGGLAALGAWIKPQAIFVGPALAVALWEAGPSRRAALARAAVAAVLVSALVSAPFVAAGTAGDMAAGIAQLATHDMLSAEATNLWWVVTWLKRAVAQLPEHGYGAFLEPVRIQRLSSWMAQGLPNPRPWATAAVLFLVAWAAWRGRAARGLPELGALSAFVVAAYFTLAVGVHENHLFLAVPLLVPAAAEDVRWRPLLAAASAVVFLNLNLIYGLGLGVGWAVPRWITGIDATVVLAVASVAFLARFGRRLAGPRPSA
jgi:hypothetical protein